ncbi:hypothetical protein Rhe02_72180 [Rhizocola hellebori]|uniref:DUF4760 domain-containing protein n=1 Tax=Rhizocola hellebori TaxID=1392758 RepID=A0A8J3QEA8_9ACTN|nr:hypothetical protein [Rhizocola hellebori]GIH09151.1 hypothetical protein Rhe02_72180 [Rhizocola hellebori]
MEILNISIAALAVILSLVTVLIGRRQRQLDALMKVQDLLLGTDVQEGRRLLYQATREGELPADQARFDLANRALANFNTVAILVRRRVVPRNWLLEDWHHTLRQMRVGYDSVVAYWRRNAGSPNYWFDLGWLISAAEAYQSKLACCTGQADDPGPEAIVLLGGPPAASRVPVTASGAE